MENDQEPPVVVDLPGPFEFVGQTVHVQLHPEYTRQRLAGILVWLFAAEMGSAIFLMGIYPLFKINTDPIRELLVLIISPTAALVGSVTGFYFGERSATRRRESEEGGG